MANTTYTHAGISTVNGRTKARFTNDIAARVKRLNSTDSLDFVTLPSPMSKLDAANYLLTSGDPSIQSTAAAQAIQHVIERHTPKAVATKSVKSVKSSK